MSELLVDHADRERFRTEWERNFAVSANAGSGKTTAISARLAAMARSPGAAEMLKKTAVVTFTKKAAAQIGQRARAVLLDQLMRDGGRNLAPLDHLERAFFGTIHSFCLLLAQRYGQTLGIHLNPTVVAEESEDAWWEQFLEVDAMQFSSLSEHQVSAFLRHVPVEHVFDLARGLDHDTASRLAQIRPAAEAPRPSQAILAEILGLSAKGSGRKNLELSQEAARRWFEQYTDPEVFLPPYQPFGTAGALTDAARRWMDPLKRWLGDVAAVLAAELAFRYRAFRVERGVQTYADQVEAALAILRDPVALDRIRREGWRVILDEAQDTDAQQFAVLVEITRPEGAPLGTWPTGEGPAPRPGHFCMVGDGQQAIYGGRADIRNFIRHLDAFRRGDGGDLLTFRVTFRAPRKVVDLLNAGFPSAFGSVQLHNVGLPVAPGALPPLLQVEYEPLAPAPGNPGGLATLFPLQMPERAPSGVEGWMVEECRQLAGFLVRNGPAGVGATEWNEVCLLAPRNDWLALARREFERAGLKVALQVRRQRQGEHPAFAWLAGLLAVACDPDNTFEWTGVLREVWGISDAVLARIIRDRGGVPWEDPELYPELSPALNVMRRAILSLDEGGVQLGRWVEKLARECELALRLRLVDPSGAAEEELSRLIAEAYDFGGAGTGARAWLQDLLGRRDEGRPSGKPEADAINLLTCHSAKGLEWPVVIPLGLWRRMGKPPESGLRIIPQTSGELLVYFDGESIPVETQESRERERMREMVRLLYVTLTRVRQHLILPWNPEFGGRQRPGASFVELWAGDGLFSELPRLDVAPVAALCERVAKGARTTRARSAVRSAAPLPALPARVLPHELSAKPDLVRAARHEATARDQSVALPDEEAIDYGLWWHETLEYMPWGAEDAVVEAHLTDSLVRAESIGMRERAEQELERLKHSEAWRVLADARWTRMTELSVLAPAREGAWIDGVMDLVLHDPVVGDVWIVDWKTNRFRVGEATSALLQRLAVEYVLQLQAYGRCIAGFFPAARLRLLLYSSAAGEWTEVPA